MGGGVVIVGGGECGARAAFALRENGYAGSITIVGSEQHLPYERPPLSKAALIDPHHTFVAPRERYASENIDLLLGHEVTAIDPDKRTINLADGRTIAYDLLLLTTGAKPRSLPDIDPASKRVLTLRTFDDTVAIRERLGPGRRLLIIGGGFIGLELAATARTFGTSVTLIESQPRILMRGVPQEIAEVVADRHQCEGVLIRCGVGISALSETDDAVEIRLADGQIYAADTVVVGIGATPNTALAERTGIAVENGIAVDDRLETSIPGIYAAGDCCSFPLMHYGGRRIRLEAWRNAQDQGTLVARSMLGHRDRITSVPWFWSDQYDLTLQVAGLADGATTHVRRDLSANSFILFHLDADGRLLAASGVGEGNAVAKDMRLAEMLIGAGAKPAISALADPLQKLKSILTMQRGNT